MMTETLQFNEERHEYTLGGVVYPSVSEIIAPLVDFSRIPAATLEFARDRGVAVHKACELLDLGTLDWTTVDERISPYITSYEAFLNSFSLRWTSIEQREHHKTMYYAGTPDRRGIVREILTQGRESTKTILVDIKATYALAPSVQVQLSGYDLMTEKPADELWSVRLCPDGTFVRTVHKPAHSTSMSCLNIFRWKQRNGLTSPKL
jgi:hypothetical protein